MDNHTKHMLKRQREPIAYASATPATSPTRRRPREPVYSVHETKHLLDGRIGCRLFRSEVPQRIFALCVPPAIVSPPPSPPSPTATASRASSVRAAWPPCAWRGISSTTAKLMTRVAGAGGEAQLTVVENFFEALTRLVPP